LLTTQSIEARAPQGDACEPVRLVVYKRESKAKERKGAERQRRSELYTIFKSRDCNCLPFTAVICRNLPFSASAVTPTGEDLTVAVGKNDASLFRWEIGFQVEWADPTLL